MERKEKGGADEAVAFLRGGIELILEKKKLSELRPADYNPRKALTPEDAEYKKIKNSIERFGYVDPIIINSDGTIIGGHQRYTVLTDLGYEEAECVVVNLNKNDEKALNIALNKITGEWDNDKLKDLLIDLDISEYDLSLTGFDTNELEELIVLPSDLEKEAIEDDFNPDNESELCFVNRGEVWQLGNHKLMCGDSTDENDIKKLMGAEQMDLIITDPPYNVNYEDKVTRLNKYRTNANGSMQISNDELKDADFYSFLLAAFKNANKCMRDGAAIYVFHADFHGRVFRQAFEDADLKLSQVLIWEKNNFVLGRSDYQWRHEPILYGWKEGAPHYFIKDRTQDTVILEDDIDFELMKKPDLIAFIKQKMKEYSEQTSVIYEKMPRSNNLHPTMKPISLVSKFMKNSSKEGWNVGDLFGGSGTTLITAEQLGRNAYVMEYDEHYASVIIKRWEEFTGQQAVRIEV